MRKEKEIFGEPIAEKSPKEKEKPLITEENWDKAEQDFSDMIEERFKDRPEDLLIVSEPSQEGGLGNNKIVDKKTGETLLFTDSERFLDVISGKIHTLFKQEKKKPGEI